MRFFTGSEVPYAPSIKQSVMIFDRGRGRGHSRHFRGRGRGFIRGGRGSYGGRQNASKKDPGNVGIVDVAISAGRNLDILSGRSYLILVLLSRVVLRVLHLLFLALPRLYYRRMSMIDSDN